MKLGLRHIIFVLGCFYPFLSQAIFYGKSAARYPYFVGVFVSSNSNGGAGQHNMCGGSLIDRQWILTSGSCVKGVENSQLTNQIVRVSVGLYSIAQDIDYQNIDNIIRSDDEAVALLHLSAPVSDQVIDLSTKTPLTNGSQSVKAIGLGRKEPDYSGSTRQTILSASAVLRETGDDKIKLYDSQKCTTTAEAIKPSELCAGSEVAITPCSAAVDYACFPNANDDWFGSEVFNQNDIGSPLLILGSDGIWKQLGIFSRHGIDDFNSSKKNQYDIYINITSYLDWIQQSLGWSPVPITWTTVNYSADDQMFQLAGIQGADNIDYALTYHPKQGEDDFINWLDPQSFAIDFTDIEVAWYLGDTSPEDQVILYQNQHGQKQIATQSITAFADAIVAAYGNEKICQLMDQEDVEFALLVKPELCPDLYRPLNWNAIIYNQDGFNLKGITGTGDPNDSYILSYQEKNGETYSPVTQISLSKDNFMIPFSTWNNTVPNYQKFDRIQLLQPNNDSVGYQTHEITDFAQAILNGGYKGDQNALCLAASNQQPDALYAKTVLTISNELFCSPQTVQYQCTFSGKTQQDDGSYLYPDFTCDNSYGSQGNSFKGGVGGALIWWNNAGEVALGCFTDEQCTASKPFVGIGPIMAFIFPESIVSNPSFCKMPSSEEDSPVCTVTLTILPS